MYVKDVVAEIGLCGTVSEDPSGRGLRIDLNNGVVDSGFFDDAIRLGDPAGQVDKMHRFFGVEGAEGEKEREADEGGDDDVASDLWPGPGSVQR